MKPRQKRAPRASPPKRTVRVSCSLMAAVSMLATIAWVLAASDVKARTRLSAWTEEFPQGRRLHSELPHLPTVPQPFAPAAPTVAPVKEAADDYVVPEGIAGAVPPEHQEAPSEHHTAELSKTVPAAHAAAAPEEHTRVEVAEAAGKAVAETGHGAEHGAHHHGEHHHGMKHHAHHHKGEHGHGEHHHHVHNHVALFFLFGGFGLGCFLQVIQERHLTFIPYTCMLFVTGFGLAALHHYRPPDHWSYWRTWSDSIEMWEHIDPHVVLYVFLPALVFSEAMRLNIKLGKRLLAQVVILACPGVIIGTLLTAAFVHYVFPYNWNWPISLVFGSILAATDPVAVVALFNTLGVSPRLTMLISGESLLNDGTAIVLFMLMMDMWRGHDITAWVATTFFFKMTVFACALGFLVGFIGLSLIFITAETRFHSDAMIQVAVTVCVGYLCFFLAEMEVQTSGVLTVVAGGVIFSYLAWPRFISRETMHTVWEFIEFLGNTIIFLLAGVLFGANAFSSKAEEHLHPSDVLWLLLLYVAATAIRAVMILVLWPFLNCCGEKITWKEAIVMTWSGLRGAVGLVLAISVDRGVSSPAREYPAVGSRFMFHVGGMALLTILVNATLASPILERLGFTKTSSIEERCVEHFERLTDGAGQQSLKETLESTEPDPRFAGASVDYTMELVPALSESETYVGGEAMNGSAKSQNARLRMYREIFMRAVQRHYYQDIDNGIVPRTSRVARILLFSCDSVLDAPAKRLKDWQVIEETLDDHPVIPCLSKLVQKWPLSKLSILSEEFFPTDGLIMTWQVYAALAFIEAHKAARKDIPMHFNTGQIFGWDVQRTVESESQSECALAFALLQRLPSDVIEAVKSRMLAGKILQTQVDKVQGFQDSGMLSEKGAGHIQHRLLDAQRVLMKTQLDVDGYLSEAGESESEDSEVFYEQTS